jgi:hypothetical protein
MRGFEIVTPISLNTYWKVIDLDTRAIGNILLQARTSADVLLSTAPGISYFTLKKDTSLVFEPEGGQIAVARGDDLLTNGTLTGSATGWTMDLDDWTYAGNAVDKDQDGVTTLSQAFGSVAGEIYELIYTLSGGGWVAGVTPSIGGTNGTKQTAIGTYTECLQAANATGLIFTPDDTSRFTIDTISVKKLSRSKLFAYAAAAVTLEVMVQQ